MHLLEVLIPPSIYHGWPAWKTIWEENITLGNFTSMNMKYFGCHNVSKHRWINGDDKYVTLDISLKFGSMDKMRIISLEPKNNLGRLWKELITYLGIKYKARQKKYKK